VEGTVISFEGKAIEMNAQTICIHSDTPNTVAIAEAVREEIKGGGSKINILGELEKETT